MSPQSKRRGTSMLKVKTLTKRFGDRTAVDSMSFDVAGPCLIGIIGCR